MAMIEGIPPPQTQPEAVPLSNISQYQMLIFNMETTGFFRRNEEVADHITHLAVLKVKEFASSEGALAARDDGLGLISNKNVLFSKFVMPSKSYSHEAAEMQSKINFCFESGQMYFHGNLVSEFLEIKTMLEQLCEFIGDQPAVMYGHSVKSFGCHVLLHAALACGMYDRLCDKIAGFVDSQYWFKGSVWKDREQDLKQYAEKKQLELIEGKKLTSYSLHTLVGFFEGLFHNPENPDALEKVKFLYRLILRAENDRPDSAAKYSFTLKYVREVREHSVRVQDYLPSWMPLVTKHVMSESMAKKAAGSGLSLQDLLRANDQGGEEGVKSVLSQSAPDGKPRVTEVQRVLKRIAEYIAENYGGGLHSPY